MSSGLVAKEIINCIIDSFGLMVANVCIDGKYLHVKSGGDCHPSCFVGLEILRGGMMQYHSLLARLVGRVSQFITQKLLDQYGDVPFSGVTPHLLGRCIGDEAR